MQSLHDFSLADVADHADRAPTLRCDGRDVGCSKVGIDVVEDDHRALAGEHARHATTDAGRTSGDHGETTFEKRRM